MTFARTIDASKKTGGFFRNLKLLFQYPSKILHNRYMVQNFLRRDLMGRFHGSMLGAWWMLVQPLFLFAIYYFVFGKLFQRGDGDPITYALYLFSGVVMFHALVEATSQSCGIVTGNNNLVKKVVFPSEALPVHVALISLVIYLIGAIVCIAAGMISGKFMPGIEILAMPLVMIVQFVMVLGIGLLLANANVFARDVSQLWRIFTMAWMFMSPVFWTPKILLDTMGPDSAIPDIMMNANPAYSLIMSHRLAIAGETPGMGAGTLWGNLGVAAIWAFSFLVIGFTTFSANKHKHADIV